MRRWWPRPLLPGSPTEAPPSPSGSSLSPRSAAHGPPLPYARPPPTTPTPPRSQAGTSNGLLRPHSRPSFTHCPDPSSGGNSSGFGTRAHALHGHLAFFALSPYSFLPSSLISPSSLSFPISSSPSQVHSIAGWDLLRHLCREFSLLSCLLGLSDSWAHPCRAPTPPRGYGEPAAP